MTTIVTETNRYASLCLKETFDKWDKVTADELHAYFGFMVLMGMVSLPSIRDYWKKDEVFNYRPITSRISRSRFLDIHRFLHFVDNDLLPPYGHETYSKIQKVKPILTYLSEKCGELFIPGQDLAVDEAMVKFKGRSSIKQYMPKKPIKRGFKIWMVADSDSGYVMKYSVYEGKTGNRVEKGLGGKVVMALTEKMHHRYHHVYFDNFFTGIDLLLNLIRSGTYGCGTMRADRKGYPSSLKPFVKKGFPSRGDRRMARNGNVSMVLWQDTKAISCASTNADPEIVKEISRKQKDGTSIIVKCPEAIVQYNAKMGGVDRNDQLRGYYNIQIKSRKSYKYLFFAAVDVAITNSYIMSKSFPNLRKKTLKDFRLSLASELIGEYSSRKRGGRPSLQRPVKCFCSTHFPTKADKRRNRCHYCVKYLNKHRQTVWQCKDCNLFFCHTGKDDDCFYLYHTQHGPTWPLNSDDLWRDPPH